MKFTFIILSFVISVFFIGCEREIVEARKSKEFESNPDYWVHHVEEFKSLRSNLFIQLTNQSSEVSPISFTVTIDDEFIFSAEIPNLRGGHHQEIFGLSIPEGKSKIRIVAGDGQAQSDREIEVKGRKFVMASFWSAPKKPDTHSLHIEESHRVFSLQ